VVLTLAQIECERDKTAVLILCGGQKLGGTYTSYKTSGNDGRLFQLLRGSSLRTLCSNYSPTQFSEMFPSVTSAVNRKESTSTWQSLIRMSVLSNSICSISVAIPLHKVDFRQFRK
jgi:hypothetical protein